jgi:hypothetical protein
MRVAQPAAAAMRAAASLVAMPPLPTRLAGFGPPAMASISGVIAATRSSRRAAGSRAGSAV